MLKKISGVVGILLLVLGFLFFYTRINSPYPNDVSIKSYKTNEEVDLGLASVKVKECEIKKQDSDNYLLVKYLFKSKDKDINIGKDGLLPKLYQNFSSSIAQNIIEIEGENNKFKPAYKINDLDIGQNSEKEIDIYYLLEDEGDYNNTLLINPNLYRDKYKKKFDSGYLYYESIDLGDIYD